MTIIVFLVDTSASMYQRAYLGGRPSILDVAKGAVETFVKVRQRSPESRCDRYMLLTFEEPPNNIKAGWKENLSTFMNELKNLQCLGLTTMGGALKHAFDVLNLNRMQTGIDTYGQGRCPFFLEPSVILVITDGGKLSSPIGVTDDFNLPMHAPIPGSELTREPFRWDQRLFALVLRLSGTPANERDIGLVPSDDSPIDAMCEVTGGRSYCITSHRMMMQCIDSLVQKVQSGVVINFEKIGPDPVAIEARLDDVPDSIMIEDPDSDTGDISDTRSIRNLQSYVQLQSSYNNNVTGTAWHSCRRMIYVPRSAQKGFAVGFWPIPESFWPDVSISVLPPRSAHPNVKFTCMNQDPMVIENLPFDKYELEPSPLTQHILARKQPTTCWQVFVPNSYKNSDVGHPFGYLKASTNLTCVNLFVMPYNYPVLLPLLDELFKVHRLKPTNEWNQLFRNYMRTMPSYYAGPLRRALTRMGAPNSLAQTLMPDNMDTTLSFSVLNYIKKLKNQAKIEFDRLCNDVLTRQNAAMKSASNGTNSSGVRVTPRSVLKRDFITHPLLVNKFLPLREQLNEYGGFVVGLPTGKTNINTKSYRNPFDIHRYNLLDQVVRMRANFLQPFSRMKLIDDDVTHSLPINQMGNYQEYLKRMPAPLRELESAPVRQHMFGNPFKIDKRMMVDEADIDLVGASSGTGTGRGTKRLSGVPHEAKLPQKRRPGPIPRDKTVRKPSSIILPHIMHNETMTLDLPIIPEELDSKAISKMESPPPSTLKITVNDYSFNFDSDLAPEIKIEDRKSLENGLPLTESHQIINVESTSLFQSSDEAFPEDSSDILYSYSSIQTDNSKATNKDLSTRTIMDNINESLQIFGKNDSSHVYRVFNDQPENEENIMPDESIDFDAYNRGIKKKLFSDVRKPGKNYRPLLDRLMLLRGDIEMREAIIRQVHKEALRFKREKMAKAISQYLVLNHIENNNSNS